MITKETFIKVMNELDAFYGETQALMEKFGFRDDNIIASSFDRIVDALDTEIDPKELARKDEISKDCGSYICDWLFGPSELNEKCPTAADLYDYIINRYEWYYNEELRSQNNN